MIEDERQKNQDCNKRRIGADTCEYSRVSQESKGSPKKMKGKRISTETREEAEASIKRVEEVIREGKEELEC